MSTRRFKPYPAYKESGVEWLGDIPANWTVKRLWHLTPPDRRIMYGIVLPGPNADDGVPIVKGGDVSPGRLRKDLLSRTTREIESRYARSRLRGGDLVYAIRGSIGEVASVPDELEGANLTQDAARIAYRSATHGPWLLHALKSTAVFAQLEVGALGATIRGINIRDLKRASIVVPPFGEQRAIVAFLERETAKIDALIEKKERLIELLQEKRTALIINAVTRGLDPNVSMRDSGFEWLGNIPSHWDVQRTGLRHHRQRVSVGAPRFAEPRVTQRWYVWQAFLLGLAPERPRQIYLVRPGPEQRLSSIKRRRRQWQASPTTRSAGRLRLAFVIAGKRA